MIIEIVGTGFSNMGAELMLAAIVDRLSHSLPEISFAVEPHIGPYQRRAQYGLLQKFEANNAGRLGRIREKLIHRGYRQRYGLVREADVASILDASGYALGDTWPEEFALSKADAFVRWRSQGKKIILLPQAMGPFQRGSTRNAYQQILNASDLIFAREPISFAHAQDLVPNHPGLKIAGDFTNLLTGPPTQTLDPTKAWAAIVPNAMMVRGRNECEKADYVALLASCASHMRGLGLEPCVLLYELKMDLHLAQAIRDTLSDRIEIHVVEDAIKLKSLTGEVKLTVGSRFHGLVNALSQGVPSIGTSWSHKYRCLFEDYGRPEWLVDTADHTSRPFDLISDIVETLEAQRRHLLHHVERHKQETETMWRDVEACLTQ